MAARRRKQKAAILPAIVRGELRLQAFGMTETASGTDTTALRATACRKGDRYVANVQKIWAGRAERSDLMPLLALPRRRSRWPTSQWLCRGPRGARTAYRAKPGRAAFHRLRTTARGGGHHAGKPCRVRAGQPRVEEANIGKMLAADASWTVAKACVQTHGGFGFIKNYEVKRKFRKTRLHQVAPISTNRVLSYMGEQVLGMPRSY